MSKQQSINKMLKLAKRLDEIVAEMSSRKEAMFVEMHRKAA